MENKNNMAPTSEQLESQCPVHRSVSEDKSEERVEHASLQAFALEDVPHGDLGHAARL